MALELVRYPLSYGISENATRTALTEGLRPRLPPRLHVR